MNDDKHEWIAVFCAIAIAFFLMLAYITAVSLLTGNTHYFDAIAKVGLGAFAICAPVIAYILYVIGRDISRTCEEIRSIRTVADIAKGKE